MAKENEAIIQATGFYAGYSAKGNFDVDLKIGFTEENVANGIKFVTAIGNQISLVAKVADEVIKLGIWNVYKVVVDHNAQCKVQFKTSKDNTFVDKFDKLITDEQDIILKAKILEE